MKKYRMLFPGGKPKCLTLSYDDGVLTDIRLGELMKAHGVAGTFNINAGLYLPEDSQKDTPTRRLRLSEAVEFYKSSPLFEVATHGLMHPSLALVPSPYAVYDIIEDRRTLEKQYGVMIRGHAYPNGSVNQEVADILKLCGIVYARTTKSTHSFDIPTDWLYLNPTCKHKDPELFTLCDRFLNEQAAAPRMFYLWGHSYEFENDNNWDIIERFLKKVSGKDDIWYATNIEIYDYISAFNSLIFSADASYVYNPSATDVWIMVSGKYTVKVPAGTQVSTQNE